MKRIYALEDKCLNCRLCEVACTTAHSKTGDIYKAFMFEKHPKKSAIHVEGDNYLSIAINCRHCDEPACVAGCIAGALSKDAQTGIVNCNTDKCVGCRTCMVQCPYGAISVKRVAVKCDMCESGWSRGEPACVKACINQALIYVDSADVAPVHSAGSKPAHSAGSVGVAPVHSAASNSCDDSFVQKGAIK